VTLKCGRGQHPKYLPYAFTEHGASWLLPSSSELAALSDSVPVPVYALEIELRQAWALGASGLNEICT
jgi:hypothetical protein